MGDGSLIREKHGGSSEGLDRKRGEIYVLFQRRFGAELIIVLENGYDLKKIAQWADEIRYKYLTEMDVDLIGIVEDLSYMILGKQYELTEEELLNLAIKLIKNN